MTKKKKKGVYITENKKILLQKLKEKLKDKEDDRGDINRDSKA